jgi:hypothetical protein
LLSYVNELKPNIGEWKKLRRLVRYVRATIHLPLIIGSDDSGNMVWSINASIAVHMDMKRLHRIIILGTTDDVIRLYIKKGGETS